MSAATGLVLLALAAGELSTVEDIDAVLRELSTSKYHDRTWAELADALLDCRLDKRLGPRSRLLRS